MAQKNPQCEKASSPQPAKKISRRRFLKIGCASGAGLGLTACGLMALKPTPQPLELEPSSYNMQQSGPGGRRLLVAYASFAGATQEIAHALGRTLGSRGFSVDVVPLTQCGSPRGYDFVIIGSGVYGSQWRPEALEFIPTHQDVLKRVPVAFFSACLAGLSKDAGTLSEHKTTVYGPLRKLVAPVDTVLFAGRINALGASLFLPNWIAKAVPTMDFRDWDRIRAWGQQVFSEVARDEPETGSDGQA